MPEPYLGEIRLMATATPPAGWALCNGQPLPINTNQALFSLLGITYGGDGRTNFCLPDLRARVPMHAGQGPGLTPRVLGEKSGELEVTLLVSSIPMHSHTLNATEAAAVATNGAGNVLAKTQSNSYAAAPNNVMGSSTIGIAGETQPHTNQQPSLAVSFCIALGGVYPSRT